MAYLCKNSTFFAQKFLVHPMTFTNLQRKFPKMLERICTFFVIVISNERLWILFRTCLYGKGSLLRISQRQNSKRTSKKVQSIRTSKATFVVVKKFAFRRSEIRRSDPRPPLAFITSGLRKSYNIQQMIKLTFSILTFIKI